MNPEISKAARDLLAKQSGAEPHPSPDLLNGYIEQALSPAEKTQVLTHLSTCAECREVVFLASGSAEEAMQSELLVAAVAQPAAPLDRVLARKPAIHSGAQTAKPKLAGSWWKWAAPLAALVIVGSTALIERDRITDLLRPPSREADISGNVGAPVNPSATTTELSPPSPRAADKTERHANTYASNLPEKQMETGITPAARASKQKNGATGQPLADARNDAVNRRMLESQLVSNLQNSNAEFRAGMPQAKAAPSVAPPQSNEAALTTEATSAAPNGGNDLTYIAPDTAQPLAKSSLVANDQAAGSLAALSMARQKNASNSRWRIGREGQLERSTATGTWTQKLASEEVSFRAITTVGNDVWAGGNSGALFHSSDGGDHFNKIVLTVNGQPERGAIVSIHFDTAQQGSVSSDSGATWTTTDGGRSWSKQ